MRRIKLTHTAILARAISDCEASIRDAEAVLDGFDQKRAATEAAFYYDNVIRPLIQERETLCMFYEIETGRPYEIIE